MKYVAAYCLLVLGGKQEVSEADLTLYLKSIDCEVNEDQVKTTVQALKGKELHELANQGIGKIASMAVASGPAPAQQQNNNAPAKGEEKKKVEEPVEEEEAVDFGDLFGLTN